MDAVRRAQRRLAASPPGRYGVAIALTLLAFVVTWYARDTLDSTRSILFFAAVTVSAWTGGFGPGLFATVLSALLLNYYLIPPIQSLDLEGSDLVVLLVFTSMASLVSWLNGVRRNAVAEQRRLIDRAERELDRRVRAEQALAASEARYRTIVQTANEGIWLIDRDARTVFANERMARLLGTRPETLAARRVTDYLFPNDLPGAQARIGANFGGQFETFDFRFRRDDGSEAHVLAATSPVRDGTGNIVGALGMFTDATERRNTEAALRVSEEHARLLADAGAALASSLDYDQTLQRVADLAVPAVADWCWVDLIQPSGAIERVTVAHADPVDRDLAARTLHYPPAHETSGAVHGVIASAHSLLVPEVDSELVERTAHDDAQRAMVRSLQIRSLMIVPLTARGQTFGAISLATSSSGRRFGPDELALAEALGRRAALAIDNARLYSEREAAEARFRALFDGTVEAIAVVDETGHFQDVNDALCTLLDSTRNELLSREIAAFFAERACWQDEFDRLKRTGERQGEWALRRSDGTAVPVEASVRRLTLPTGPVFVAVLRDVTERRAADTMREEFLAAVSHDLKNPLAGLKANTQVLLRAVRQGRPLDPERTEHALASIDAAAQRMVGLIDALVDAAKLRAGQPLTLNREAVDLVALAESCVDQYRPTAPRHDLVVDSDQPELVGEWDPARLERVIGNLLTNAIKYSSGGGTITLRVRRERESNGRDWAVLAIEDQGLGIPAADLPHVFDHLRRGANVGRIAGTGIGLAGVRRIIAEHGGTISVASQEGKGSTFTVRLPLAMTGDVPPIASAEPIPPDQSADRSI